MDAWRDGWAWDCMEERYEGKWEQGAKRNIHRQTTRERKKTPVGKKKKKACSIVLQALKNVEGFIYGCYYTNSWDGWWHTEKEPILEAFVSSFWLRFFPYLR